MSSALKWTNEVNFHALLAIIHLKVNMSSITACSDKRKIIMENKQISPLLFGFQDVVATEQRGILKVKAPHVSSSVFRLFVEGEDNCTVDPLQLHTLTSCGFNSSNPLIIITHGWSVRSTFLPLH